MHTEPIHPPERGPCSLQTGSRGQTSCSNAGPPRAPGQEQPRALCSRLAPGGLADEQCFPLLAAVGRGAGRGAAPTASSTHTSSVAGADWAGMYGPVSHALGRDQSLLNPGSQGIVPFPWHVPRWVDMEQHGEEMLQAGSGESQRDAGGADAVMTSTHPTASLCFCSCWDKSQHPTCSTLEPLSCGATSGAHSTGHSPFTGGAGFDWT